MDKYVKIRCSSEQREAWQEAAGLAGVSTWARDALDRAAKAAPFAPAPRRDVIRKPSEAARIAAELQQAGEGLCRHGLLNCRICSVAP